MERFFRFGKQRLLTDKTRTPEIIHEEAWVQLTSLAYVQLYPSGNTAGRLPYPWVRCLPEHAADLPGPASHTHQAKKTYC